jgi:biotin transport system substrate-specific component
MLLGEIYMKRSITKTLTFLALFTALMCVLSPFAIPMQPVPITLATLVVYIIAGLLDYKYAAIPVVLYILIGLMGVPVFSNGTAGLAVLGGPTAGFIYGYILGALAESLLLHFFKEKKWMVYPIAMVVATIFIYAFGLTWFMIYMNNSGKAITFGAALMACVVPFLLGDAIKIIAASSVCISLRKHFERYMGTSLDKEDDKEIEEKEEDK